VAVPEPADLPATALAAVPPAGHQHGSSGVPVEAVVLGLAAVAVVAYLLAARRSSSRRAWPRRRCALRTAGVAAAVAGALGPTAVADHADLVAHMVGHLLLGMAAPLPSP
jgi:putative membrane protein